MDRERPAGPCRGLGERSFCSGVGHAAVNGVRERFVRAAPDRILKCKRTSFRPKIARTRCPPGPAASARVHGSSMVWRFRTN